MSRMTRMNIIASVVLGYIIFPNKARFIGWIFLWKGIDVHQSLKAIRKEIIQEKYIAFVFDAIRFTIS